MTTSHVGKRGIAALLWAINLSSICASVLTYIYLAHYAYSALNSLLTSEFVMLAPMMVPVVLAFQLNQVTSRIKIATLMRLANLLGAATCAVLFLGPPLSTVSVLLGATVVGALDAVQRVARIVVIKHYFSADEVRFTVPLTLTAQFIAGALAGGILAFFPGQVTVQVAAGATTSLFIFAAACTFFLPRPPQRETTSATPVHGLLHSLALMRQIPALRESLVSFVLLGTFLQGFYSISRVALPAHHLSLSQQLVGVFQIMASVAALSGALCYYFFSKRGASFNLFYLYPACTLAMVLSCVGKAPVPSFAMYFVYFFVFELCFFRLQADIMAATPAEHMPLIATLQYALVYMGMIAAIAVGAFTIQWFGMAATAIVFVLGFAASHLVWRSITQRLSLTPTR